MLALPNLISYVLCFISFVYVAMSLYGLNLDEKKQINRVFFLMCMALGIWSMSYALALVAKPSELDKALQFNQIAVLGYGFFYSYALHMIKLIAENKNKLSNKYVFLLYTPSVYFLFSCLLLGDYSKSNFNMVCTIYGWTSLVPVTIPNFLFDAYVLVFSCLFVKYCFKWRNNVKDKEQLHLLKITIYATIVAFVFSMITDVISLRILHYPVLHFTVFWLFFPVIALFYGLLKTRIISPIEKINFNESIDEKYKTIVFQLLGYCYLVFSYLVIILDYMDSTHYKNNSLFIMVVCFCIAVIFIFFTKLLPSPRMQHVVVGLISFVSMYIIYDRYTDSLAITIWAIIFCYIYIITVFQKPRVGIFVYLSGIGLQVVLWLQKPFTVTHIDWEDYVLRIILITMGSLFVYAINRAYRKKTRDNLRYLHTQKVMNNFSEKILELNIYNGEQKVLEFLRILNNGFKFSTSAYVRFIRDVESQCWIVNDKFASLENNYDNTILKYCPQLLERLKAGETISVVNIKNDNNVDDDLREALMEKSVDGLYAFSIMLDDKVRAITLFEFEINATSLMIRFYEDMLKNLIGETIKKIDSENELFIKANFDDITYLKNRSYFKQQVTGIITDNPDKNYFVMYLDIDNFKTVNDIFGHLVGDQLLLEIANGILNLGHIDNIVTRFGNDDFIIFCDASYTRDTVTNFAEMLVLYFKNGINLGEHKFRLNINIGIASYDKDGADIASLVRNADIAMTTSKKNPSTHYHFCDMLDKVDILENARYTEKLYTAINNNEFNLAFQPQIDIHTETVIGAEALLRWQSREFGLVPPNKFIPILESTGLIVEVGEWIMEEAFRQQVEMRNKGLKVIRISINLSAVQFLDVKLIDKIESLMAKYRPDPQYIEFEITESVAINDDSFISEAFDKIKQLGFSIAIDDFGTGFSSLHRLQSLALDRLKIDKSFVDGIGIDPKKERIVNVIIDLAKNLDLVSIAEGVEDEKQLQYLREHNCDEIQGYYYAKPMYKDEFERFVSQY